MPSSVNVIGEGVRVVINGAALESFLNGPNGPVLRELLRRGRLVESAAKRACPVDTGRLRSSIGPPLASKIDNRPAVLVGTIVEYAIYQELGTRYVTGRHYLQQGLLAASG